MYQQILNLTWNLQIKGLFLFHIYGCKQWTVRVYVCDTIKKV